MTDLPAVTSYDTLIEALRARKAELGLTDEVLESIIPLTKGHIGKLLGAKRLKTLGVFTFDAMMTALALKLLPVEDAKAAAKMMSRWERRERPQPIRTNVRTRRARWLFNSRDGRKTRNKYLEKLTPKQRSEIAQRLNKARWSRKRRPANPPAARARDTSAAASPASASPASRPPRSSGTAAVSAQRPRR